MKKLWIWKNFVNGNPEYWVFDNPFPCDDSGGDPMTLGEPCGYAVFKESVPRRTDISELEVIDRIKRARGEVQELREALIIARETIKNLHENGDWDNGVYDPTNSICEGVITTGSYVTDAYGEIDKTLAKYETTEGI